MRSTNLDNNWRFTAEGVQTGRRKRTYKQRKEQQEGDDGNDKQARKDRGNHKQLQQKIFLYYADYSVYVAIIKTQKTILVATII